MTAPALPSIERRFTSIPAARARIETRADGQKLIVGYAAVFYRAEDPGTEYQLWSDYLERVAPGAFTRAMAEDDVRGLVNHDPNQLLGRASAKTLALSVDAVGLRYEITPPDTQAGRDALVSLERGDLTGSSFSFIARKTTYTDETVDGHTRTIAVLEDVQLFDVGPVTFPAYGSTTSGLRSADGIEATLAARHAWRVERQAASDRRVIIRQKLLRLKRLMIG